MYPSIHPFIHFVLSFLSFLLIFIIIPFPYPSIYPSQDIHLIAGREPELVILDSGDAIQLVLVLLADVG